MKISNKVTVNAQRLPVLAAAAVSSWNAAPARDFVAAHAGVMRSVKPRTATPAVKAVTTYVRGTAQVLIPDPNPPV